MAFDSYTGLMRHLILAVPLLACGAPVLAAAQVVLDGRMPPKRPPALAGCWRFTAGRDSPGPASGGGYGAPPPGLRFTPRVLFVREGAATYVLRALADGGPRPRRPARRSAGGSWHPRGDSVFAVFGSPDGRSGVALRFRVLGDSLDGMARPFTHDTRWEPDVPVAARRAPCPRRAAPARR